MRATVERLLCPPPLSARARACDLTCPIEAPKAAPKPALRAPRSPPEHGAESTGSAELSSEGKEL